MSTLLERLSAPPAQHLHILQPTPYTTKYTVSTRSAPQTLAAKVLQYVGIAIRVVLGTSAIFLLWAKWATCSEYGRPLSRKFGSSIHFFAESTGGLALLGSLCRIEWVYLLPSAAIILSLVVRRGYTGTYPFPALPYFPAIPNTHSQKSPSL